MRSGANTIKHDDYEPRRDYQAWCGKYPTFAALFDAAETEVLKASEQKAA